MLLCGGILYRSCWTTVTRHYHSDVAHTINVLIRFQWAFLHVERQPKKIRQKDDAEKRSIARHAALRNLFKQSRPHIQESKTILVESIKKGGNNQINLLITSVIHSWIAGSLVIFNNYINRNLWKPSIFLQRFGWSQHIYKLLWQATKWDQQKSQEHAALKYTALVRTK